MSHYHLEIIMPNSKKIESDIEKILMPFSENDEENRNAFYDWYSLGGRWTGEKIKAKYKPETLDAFYKDLIEKKVTVSGVQSGKQTLQPKDQIPMVDKLWNSYFPDGGSVCPLFDHFKADTESVDICSFLNIPEYLTAARVIIVNPEKTEAAFMIEDSFWNGVNFIDTKWDGKVKSAIEMYLNKIKRYKEEWVIKNTPNADWICVTVDYHS